MTPQPLRHRCYTFIATTYPRHPAAAKPPERGGSWRSVRCDSCYEPPIATKLLPARLRAPCGWDALARFGAPIRPNLSRRAMLLRSTGSKTHLEGDSILDHRLELAARENFPSYALDTADARLGCGEDRSSSSSSCERPGNRLNAGGLLSRGGRNRQKYPRYRPPGRRARLCHAIVQLTSEIQTWRQASG